MDPHLKPRSVAAPGKNAAVATMRGKMAGGAPQRRQGSRSSRRDSDSVADNPKPPLQKSSKMSPPPAQKRAKKCPDQEAMAKKKSFQDDNAAPGSHVRKVNKASTEEATLAGNTPLVPLEKGPVKAVVPETTFGSSQTCWDNPFKSASHWLEQIDLAESVDEHALSAEFFDLAIKWQARVRIRMSSTSCLCSVDMHSIIIVYGIYLYSLYRHVSSCAYICA